MRFFIRFLSNVIPRISWSSAPSGQFPRRNGNMIPYRRVWRKGAVEKNRLAKLQKRASEGPSHLSRRMFRFLATNVLVGRDQFNVSSRPIKTNVATNQSPSRRGGAVSGHELDGNRQNRRAQIKRGERSLEKNRLLRFVQMLGLTVVTLPSGFCHTICGD